MEPLKSNHYLNSLCEIKQISKKMNKYFKFMAFAMMAVFSLAFVSCEDDDDAPSMGDGKIEVNGKQYSLSPITNEGSWDAYDNTGDFTVAVMNADDVDYYNYVKKQGWDDSCMYGTYRHWLGIRDG